MAVCVKTLRTLIMTTFLLTIFALHFLARHGCVCENALYPHHDYNYGHHVGLTFSCKTCLKCLWKYFIPSSRQHFWPPCWPYIFLQDMAVSLKALHSLIMTTFWPPCWPYIFLQDMAVCVETLYTLIMISFLEIMLGLHFLARHGCVCEKTLYSHRDYSSGHHVVLTFSFKT